MSDLISRADAIEAVYQLIWDEPPYCDSEALCRHIAKEIVGKIPSAETHEIRTETHGVCSDLISRADVLEGLKHSTAYLHDDIYCIVNRIPSAEATGALDDAITKYVADGYMLPPSGDLISRAEVIDAIDDAIDADSPQWAILRTKIGFLPSAKAVQRGW